MEHASGLRAYGVDDLGYGVAGHGGENAAEEVEIGIALCVGHSTAFARRELDGLVVEQIQPIGQHPAVAGQQLNMRFLRRALQTRTESGAPSPDWQRTGRGAATELSPRSRALADSTWG